MFVILSIGKAVAALYLATLIEDEGYRGEFFEPESVTSLANAIKAIVTNDAYRIQLGEANFTTCKL